MTSYQPKIPFYVFLVFESSGETDNYYTCALSLSLDQNFKVCVKCYSIPLPRTTKVFDIVLKCCGKDQHVCY